MTALEILKKYPQKKGLTQEERINEILKNTPSPSRNKPVALIKNDFDWLQDYFKNEDVFIVGGGASLIGFDFSKLEGQRIIVINHSYMEVKDFDILVFQDYNFIKGIEKSGHSLQEMNGKVFAGPQGRQKTKGNIFSFQNSEEISDVPGVFFGKHQTGLVAINIAIQGNAKNIYLLGFDCKFIDGHSHYYDEDRPYAIELKEDRYSKHSKRYNEYKKYKNIFNLSEDSKITAFKKIKIETVL